MHDPTQPDGDTQLEPLSPDEALDMYLAHREGTIADKTYRAHRIRLSHFLRWCNSEDINNINNLTGRDLHRYKLWRKDDGDLNRVSVKTQMGTLRVFLKFCADIDAIHPLLPDAIELPTLDYGERARSEFLGQDRAEQILDRLDTYQYASRAHAVFALMWHTAMRQGTIRGLDVEDVSIDDQHISVSHRPATGTTLKNRNRGQRLVAIDAHLTRVLDDWIHERRPDVTDDEGRHALFATTMSGRVSRTSIRRACYKLTCPQFIGAECGCDVAEHTHSNASKCVDSLSPHAVRRGSITAHLRDGVAKQVVSDRCDVSTDVLDDHYNELTEAEKLEQRRDQLRDRTY